MISSATEPLKLDLYKNFTNNSKQEGTNQTSKESDVVELEKADSNVKRHEAAHISAGGGIVSGGANFTYEQGSDGKMYAIGGEVPIDTSEESSPEATIAKARQIASAALSPSDPSPQDYKVAATASMMEMKAKMELSQEKLQIVQDQASRAYASNI